MEKISLPRNECLNCAWKSTLICLANSLLLREIQEPKNVRDGSISRSRMTIAWKMHAARMHAAGHCRTWIILFGQVVALSTAFLATNTLVFAFSYLLSDLLHLLFKHKVKLFAPGFLPICSHLQFHKTLSTEVSWYIGLNQSSRLAVHDLGFVSGLVGPPLVR